MSLELTLIPESMVEGIGARRLSYKPVPAGMCPDDRPHNLLYRAVHEPHVLLAEIYNKEHPELADFWECNSCALSRLYSTARGLVERRVQTRIVESVLKTGQAVHLVIYADSNLFSTLVLISKLMSELVGKYSKKKLLLDVHLVCHGFGALLIPDGHHWVPREQQTNKQKAAQSRQSCLTQMLRLFHAEGWLRHLQFTIYHHPYRYIAAGNRTPGTIGSIGLAVLYAMDWLDEIGSLQGHQADFLLMMMGMPAESIIYSITSLPFRILAQKELHSPRLGIKTFERTRELPLSACSHKDPAQVAALEGLVKRWLSGEETREDEKELGKFFDNSRTRVEDLVPLVTLIKKPRKPQAKLWCDCLKRYCCKLFLEC
jgi:hypothetical protein